MNFDQRSSDAGMTLGNGGRQGRWPHAVFWLSVFLVELSED